MTNEERAVFIGERLFSLVDVNRLDIPSKYRFSRHGELCKYTYRGVDSYTFKCAFDGWLSSPEGIAEVKAKMIEKGYDMLVSFSKREGTWECEFCTNGFDLINEQHGHTEAEAVLAACEKALRGEISDE